MNPLMDKEFLKSLDDFNNKEVYVRVTALTFDEEPIEMIEGRATGGSINIDGASAIRRTCSLSLIAQDININEFYWGLNNKVKIEVGLKNIIDSRYPNIIWFPQGTFIITAFKTQMQSNGYTISISGQDKMCLLNGSIGGSLPASVDFGVEEQYDRENDTVTYTKIPIKTIIREMLHTYALEPYHNIIINDLDDRGLELLEYRGDQPLYLLYDAKDGQCENITFNGNQQYYILKDGNMIPKKLNELDESDFNKALDGLLNSDDLRGSIIYTQESGGAEYTASKAEYGRTIGFRLTDLTYPGDLISNIGESITSILDKIKNMLGNFEYGYDVYGRFIFQKKKTYISTSWSPIVGTEEDRYVENASYAEKHSYYFNGNNLISSFSNDPDLKNIRNDYSIWGVRTTASGEEVPVHFRYAIHKYPTYYKSYDEINYYSNEYVGEIPTGTVQYDWRELIYQMAMDYYKYGQRDDFLSKVGKTGYEQFYIDMQGFWRQLYDPEKKKTDDFTKDKYFSAENIPWADAVIENPDTLNFWIDFTGMNGSEWDKYSILAVGNRPKVVNDTTIKSIYYRNVPNLIFVSSDSKYDPGEKPGYSFINIANEMLDYFTISAQGKSAKDELDELLYNHSYCTESISISAIPIYYLEPNVSISVYDELSKINGEYIISKITLPLTYNGQMTIQASKAPQRFN